MKNNFERKTGSLEEAIAGITIKDENKYQQLFKKELEKAGKGIGAMTPAEKKAFFNKIDKMYKGKNEEVEEGVEYVEYMAKNSGQAGTIANMFKGKTGGGEIHKSGSEVRIDAAKNIEAIHKQVMAKFPDTNVMTAEAYLDEMFGNKVIDPTTAAALRVYLKGKAGGAPFPPVVEGMMSKIDQMQKDGKSAADIAKALKLDVKTVKGILGETHMSQTAKANQQQKDAKGEKEIIKSVSETIKDMWKEAAEKKEKKKDIAPNSDNIDENEPEEEEEQAKPKENTDKLKNDIEKKDDEIAVLKQKIEQEKNKAIQKDTSKMVNPETGEPLLQVGIAYKHLRNKMKQEAVTVKKEEDKEQNKNKKTADSGTDVSKVDVNPEIEYDK
mgnify:FL=1